ncbi:MAG: phosphate acyltransferase PlsX [Dehalococcoidia bacterium]
MKLALDAMGGDSSPEERVKGALLAVKELDVEVALVGPEDVIAAELAKHPRDPRISIVNSADAISMEEDEIVRTVRRSRDASTYVAMELVKCGEVAGMVSAGNTGAVMATAFLSLGRIEGIERPAVALVLVYNTGRVLLIDTGANIDCRPNHLLQFGQMGSVYMQKVFGIARPRVGLLSNGEEPTKGNELVLGAHERLRESDLNFIGNIEGTHVHQGLIDVLVADGFTGNIALKAGEGIADYIIQQVTAAIKSRPWLLVAGVILKPAIKKRLSSMQYQETGGAVLLGVDGIVVIAHGRSNAIAIKNALKVAKVAADHKLMETMRASFSRQPKTTPPATS